MPPTDDKPAPPPLPRNRIAVRKLLSSKWTAVVPRDRERHFIVVKVVVPEPPDLRVKRIELEAVHSGRTFELDWRELKDATRWAQGWRR